MDSYRPSFEECEARLSAYIRELTLKQIEHSVSSANDICCEPPLIPKTLIRYWHDPSRMPEDVRVCLDSWNRLSDDGFEFQLFDDISAAAYIADAYGERERHAFARCSHPAMRCDYLRMCFVLAEGGLYVDADDVLLGDDWKHLFRDDRLKVQPLCYDIRAGRMMPTDKLWRADLPTDNRIFYVNNNPLAASANHPVLRRALDHATDKLLNVERFPEIQSTTGPGNFTVALANHAYQLELTGLPVDFELLRNWDSIAETRWDLSYRGDERNWRNVFGC
jgi:hypothetical protein